MHLDEKNKIINEIIKPRAIERMNEKDFLFKKLKEKESVVDFPVGILRSVEKRVDMLRKWGIEDSEKISQAIDFFSKEIRSIYSDHRFDIPSGIYLRLILREWLDEFLSSNDYYSYDKFALLCFDVNGLKSINDIFNHSVGDEYLQRIVRTLKEGETTKRLIERSCNMFFTSDGGDEFTFIINCNNSVDYLNIISQYEEEVRGIDCTDLIDLESEEIKKRFAECNLIVPKNFIFKASISGGSVTLKEIIDNIKSEEIRNYEFFLRMVIGEMIDVGNNSAQSRKEDYKKKLADGNEEEQFLSVFLSRNRENVILERRVRELKEEIKKIKGE